MVRRDANGKFIKGQSGNPAGRPKKEREERFYEVAITAVSFTDWREIIEKAVAQAKRGDPTARKFLADYLMGLPTNKVEVTGAEGKDMTIRLVWQEDLNE